jgi:hypothetical protein
LRGCAEKVVKCPPVLQNFQDVKHIALQRDEALWRTFYNWTKDISKTSRVVKAGDTLAVERNGVHRRHPVIRNSFLKPPVPPDTLAIVTRATRPWDAVIDQLLETDHTLSVEITRIVCVGTGKYFRVFFEILGGREVCVKLFDD